MATPQRLATRKTPRSPTGVMSPSTKPTDQKKAKEFDDIPDDVVMDEPLQGSPVGGTAVTPGTSDTKPRPEESLGNTFVAETPLSNLTSQPPPP